jgi:hypothetical protein
LVRSETDIPGGLETTDYRYGPDSTVAETRRLGVLSTRLTSRDGEKVLVELFDRGKKFLEEVWDGGRKTIERYFRDDLVVRERTL